MVMGYMKQIVNKLSSGKNAFRIVIGAMTTWILMIAVEADGSVPTEILLNLVLFAFLLLSTYVFASVIGEEIIVRRQTSLKRVFQITLEVFPVLLSTMPPILIFVIASFGIITAKIGLLLSDFSLLIIIFLMGFLAGKSIAGVTRGLLDGALAIVVGAGFTQRFDCRIMMCRAQTNIEWHVKVAVINFIVGSERQLDAK